MKKITMKEFQDKSNIEIIKELMKKNKEYINSKELDMFDLHRMYLSIMQDKGIIKKVAPGIYIDVNIKKDNYYIFGLSMPNAIFSHITALYFHGLSTKSPNCVYDITVKRSYDSTHLRKQLTNIWQEGGITDGKEYAILTNEIYKEWSGMTAKEYKEYKGLRKESLRDNMDNLELILTDLSEETAKRLAEKHKPQGLDQNKEVARMGGHAAKVAREDIEKNLGESVVTKQNRL